MPAHPAQWTTGSTYLRAKRPRIRDARGSIILHIAIAWAGDGIAVAHPLPVLLYDGSAQRMPRPRSAPADADGERAPLIEFEQLWHARDPAARRAAGRPPASLHAHSRPTRAHVCGIWYNSAAQGRLTALSRRSTGCTREEPL